MNRGSIIEKIEFIKKFKIETTRLETKAAKVDFPQNVMILYLVFQINMVVL